MTESWGLPKEVRLKSEKTKTCPKLSLDDSRALAQQFSALCRVRQLSQSQWALKTACGSEQTPSQASKKKLLRLPHMCWPLQHCIPLHWLTMKWEEKRKGSRCVRQKDPHSLPHWMHTHTRGNWESAETDWGTEVPAGHSHGLDWGKLRRGGGGEGQGKEAKVWEEAALLKEWMKVRWVDSSCRVARWLVDVFHLTLKNIFLLEKDVTTQN